MNETPRPPLLERMGLHRPELRAWAMYDWANSAMITIVVTAVFPIFFSTFAAAGLPPGVATARFAWATTVGLLVIAVLAPILGAIADFAAVKKRMLAAFLMLGAGAVAAMYLIQRGEWLLAAVLFVLANIGANGSFVFYDSLLPHVARQDEMDRVSTAGYALGYLGGGLLLAFSLFMIERPETFGLGAEGRLTATRLSFVLVALWWLGFSIPLFRRVSEPPPTREPDEDRNDGVVVSAFRRLGETFRELRQYRQALLMLLAFLIYNDGIGTIIRMATIYGTELGLGSGELIGAIVLVQFVGIPFAFLFGSLAGRIGAKRAVFLGLAVYCLISIVGFFMTTATHFYILAGLVGVVQGGTQGLSRSLFASMIPRYKSGEFFGFFAVIEKFAGIFGPAIFAMTIAATGSSRNAILSIIAFFVVGGILLSRVQVEEGQRRARAAEAAVRTLQPVT